jgi:hypothetical protein
MVPFEFQVLRWEVRHFYEKDENFNFVLVDGQQVSLDAWVVMTVRAGRSEFLVEVDLSDFERNILPKILDPMIRFWGDVAVGDPLFAQRAATLAWLLEQKAQYPHLCEP